jgi:hypothetical protein
MKVLSASEAVWPALLRTYAYLFQTFKWETFLKLTTVATIGEAFLVSFRFWVPNTFPFDVDTRALKSFLLVPEYRPVTILAAVEVFLGGLFCYYLVLRFRIAFIHSLIHQTTEFRSASKLYSAEADRFFTACMLFWLSFLVALALLFALVAVAIYTVIGTPTAEGKLDPGNFLIMFFPCIGIALVLIVAILAAKVVLNDFILPHMAIEGATFGKAWTAVWSRIAANRETFISYFILRMTMLLVAGMILGFLAWVAGLIVFAILSRAAAGFTAVLDGTDDVRAYLLVAVQTLFMLLGLGAGSVIAVSFGGPICVFMRSYALFYYGSRFQGLGDLLDPPPPPVAPAL